jgi:UDP-N-acetylmuramyl pentapeptide phosphotransferase/UDP-N-acetylglucosamine-1-phosphate transferase
VARWPEFADRAQVGDARRDQIQKTHRLSLPEAGGILALIV